MKYYIYKITLKTDPTVFYIGSTNSISSRRSSHKKYYKCKTSKKYWTCLYVFIRASGGWESFDMDIIHEGMLSDMTKDEEKKEIKKIEQTYIDNLKPLLNTINATKNKLT